jgi:hypothetical protein
LTLRFGLLLAAQFLAKRRKTLALGRRAGILLTEIPIIAQPFGIVRLLGHGNAVVRQVGRVEAGQLGRKG